MRRWLILGLLMTTLFSGCGDDSENIHIRIRNNTGMEIENFWLGAGGRGPSTISYGSIDAGETTDYQAVEPVLARYRKLNFITIDGRQYLDTIYFEDWVGSAELAPGRYTFAYTLTNGEAQLTLIVD